jgi:NADH-quinone oxidoreductase subunit E
MERNELRPLLRKRFPQERASLLPALHFLQHEFSYLPDWALEMVGWHLHIPASEVYGAATSYSELRLSPPGRRLVRVCSGLSCWSNGGKALLDHLKAQLSLEPGETTSDGEVTLEETSCGFLCPMAPAVEIDGRWWGRVDIGSVNRLIWESARHGTSPA